MNNPGTSYLRVVFVTLMTLLVSSCESRLQTSGPPAEGLATQLPDPDFLLGDAVLDAPLATTAFTPPGESGLPVQAFNGRLSLEVEGALNNIATIVDTFDIAGDAQSSLSTLPPFSFEFVSDGPAIIPVQREPQRTDHPYWEIILEPGQSWTNPADKGWSRASLPFGLKEKNQNCIHNGLMTFLFKTDGSISRVVWQVTSETCVYLKVNLWGSSEAKYTPGGVSASGDIIAAYRKEIASRLPVRPLATLGKDFQGFDQTALAPPGIGDASVFGLVINGIHYRSECPTRYGPYPFCDVLDLPSYSLAKSIFGGLAYLIVSKQWPEFISTPVSSLVPECKLADGRWDEVTPANLVNMTTGNYNSRLFNADEDNEMSAFFLAETHDEKLKFSCEVWPRKSPSGSQWVYHTTDTYLLGVAMNNFMKQKKGKEADIYHDMLYPQLLQPLNLSPLLKWSQRTYDDVQQPFTGYGLILHNDDLVRIAMAINGDSAVSAKLAGTYFDAAMFRTGATPETIPGSNGLAYATGFWGVDASAWIGCSTATWIPFMSGFGGIAVALLPNGSVYYFFTDSNQHTFRKAVTEANKALNYCKE